MLRQLVLAQLRSRGGHPGLAGPQSLAQAESAGVCYVPDFCGDELGGFWGWVEFDRWADGSITGDGEFAGCSHTVGGGGPGSAGAGHSRSTSLRHT